MLLIPTTRDLHVPLCTLKRPKATQHPPPYRIFLHPINLGIILARKAQQQSRSLLLDIHLLASPLGQYINRGTAAVEDVSEKRYKMGYLGHGHEI